jgi:hypothetical protein
VFFGPIGINFLQDTQKYQNFRCREKCTGSKSPTLPYTQYYYYYYKNNNEHKNLKLKILQESVEQIHYFHYHFILWDTQHLNIITWDNFWVV